MKIFLILLQLTILAACATVPNTTPLYGERELSSVVEGDNCYLIIEDFFKVSPVTAKKKFENSVREYVQLKASEQNLLGNLVQWARTTFATSYADNIIESFDSLLFIDYKSSFNSLYKASIGEMTLDDAKIHELYGASYANYKRASEYLSSKRPQMDIATLKKVHEYMMEGGIDGIPLGRIGKIREENIIGNVPVGIPESVVNEMNKNIYLMTDELVKDGAGKYVGRIWYPNIFKMTPELAEKIKTINPALATSIEKLASQFASGAIKGQEYEAAYAKLNSKFVTALVEDLLSWFVRQRDTIGEINTPEKLYELCKTVAIFQKSMISIHPFRDGNGRTIRQFAIYHVFDSIGFPKPRFIDPDDDIYTSTEVWTQAIIDGIRNTQRLYENAESRISQGLPLETTPELLIASFKETEKVGLKRQTPASFTPNYRNKEVDIRQVQAFFQMKLEDQNLRKRMSQEPRTVYDEIINEYYTFYKISNLDYEHEKKGLEALSVNLIDSDFRTSFGNKSYKVAKNWKSKMASWYEDTIVWRGLSRKTEEIQEAELLTMFQKVNVQFVSNNVARKFGANTSFDAIKKYIFEDFAHYNHDLVTDGLEKMAKDHSESGPMYSQSYGYSTSIKREVGKAFAMGAMVIAPYGKQKDFQDQLKSRVLVGMKKAKKDVFLSRLKQLRPGFSYKYPRQQEVMGIGAADPDSVMFVQLIDENGGVIKSYIRNPEKPNEILVFNREIDSLEDLDIQTLAEAHVITI
jgi:fido (protein-threonine AMPylation protein)